MGNALTSIDDQALVEVLGNSLYPGAKAESIRMVLSYCKATGYDPMLKPAHIVPMNVKNPVTNAYEWRDIVMPGIGLYRIMADRSGTMAGISEPTFGPDITKTFSDKNGNAVEVTFPEYCTVTARKLVGNHIVDFTAREYWMENYATAGKCTAPNAMWAKRPRGQLAKCFDERTEVLTTNGFERFDRVTGKILQATDEGLAPCDAKPFAQDYSGHMIVSAGTRLNFSVTPNHDMITTNGKIEAGALFEQATKASGKFHIPRAPAARQHGTDDTDAVLQLLGYFLADGSHTGYRQFRIAVSRQHKINTLLALGMHDSERVKRDAGREALAAGRTIVTQSDKTSFTYDWSLIAHLAGPDKTVNMDRLVSLSQHQARALVSAILEFDGSDNGNGVKRLSQKNEHVLAAFEVAAVQAGYSVGPRAETISDIGSAFTVTLSAAEHFDVVKGVEKNRASLVCAPNTSGKVWCVTVPSGAIVVRRDGFSMLCGNCSEAQALRKGWPEVGSAPTADEMEGKSLDAIEGEFTREAPKQERTSAPKADKPAYPEEKLAGNLPTWHAMVDSGKQTSAQLIAFLETKFSLTAEQKARIAEPQQEEAA